MLFLQWILRNFQANETVKKTTSTGATVGTIKSSGGFSQTQ